MVTMDKSQLVLFCGRAHPELGQAVAKHLDIPLGNMRLSNFADGEISFSLNDSVRGKDVFILQTHSVNVNEHLMEQAIMIDAAKRASARSITAVCPFLAYARQDRKSSGREPISARLVVDILAVAGADRIMSIDLHSGQIQGFFSGPFDHLIARPTLADYVRKNFKHEDLVIVSPDAGRVKSAERYSSDLGANMAIIHKHRSSTKLNTVEARYLIGDVKGKQCLIIDDMVDTAGTLCAAADILAAHGAAGIHGLATHGVLSDPAIERIEKSAFTDIVITDSLPQYRTSKKIVVLSIAPLLADAITAVFSGESVSALFDGSNQF